jgi:hypothetical protein
MENRRATEAWAAYLTNAAPSPECERCDDDRIDGASICSSCGRPIELEGRPSFWEQVAAARRS